MKQKSIDLRDPIEVARHWYLNVLSGPVESDPEPLAGIGDESVSIEDLFSPDYINHVVPGPKVGWKRGVEGARQILKIYRSASPDLQITILEQSAIENRVLTRYMVTATHTGAAFFGVKANGRRYTVTATHVDRIENGKFVESWGSWDLESLIAQMGVAEDAAVIRG
jgi:predicted ester cyclase